MQILHIFDTAHVEFKDSIRCDLNNNTWTNTFYLHRKATSEED